MRRNRKSKSSVIIKEIVRVNTDCRSVTYFKCNTIAIFNA
jgi:hypothetical protein